MKKIVIFTLFFANFILGCASTQRVSEESIHEEIEMNLSSGSSSEAIEAYFKGRDLPITYDTYTNTYRSLIKAGSEDERKFTVVIPLSNRIA
jgi:hypothetical protein